VPVVESVRDLGVLISNDLQPSVHVNDIVSRAHKRAAAILCAFVTRDSSLLMRAFLTYVRPILEYNSIIWSTRVLWVTLWSLSLCNGDL